MLDILLFLIVACSFITVFLFVILVFSHLLREKTLIASRLRRIQKEAQEKENPELSQPLFSRLIRPVMDDLSKAVLKIAPGEIVSSFERKIIMAGYPYKMSLKDWISLQVIIMLFIPLVTIVIGYYSGSQTGKIIFFCAIEIVLTLLMPNLILNRKIMDRQKKIINSLPDVIDLLTVSVEAGLGFDGALAKVVDKMPGPVADEFDNVLQEIKVGKQRREALRDMADRVAVQDMNTFIGSIIQADQFGVSIGNVLRVQSEQMRQRRKLRAQEKAMKAPVKMLLPMVMFIFPAIFAVILGPVVIRVIKVFAK